jgi:hypothetical protein
MGNQEGFCDTPPQFGDVGKRGDLEIAFDARDFKRPPGGERID